MKLDMPEHMALRRAKLRLQYSEKLGTMGGSALDTITLGRLFDDIEYPELLRIEQIVLKVLNEAQPKRSGENFTSSLFVITHHIAMMEYLTAIRESN